jgi:NAD(P) transhydrogenase subunit alpha
MVPAIIRAAPGGPAWHVAPRWDKREGVIAGILKESFPGERRVALVPSVLPALAKAGVQVVVETGAGDAAGFTDREYQDKGAEIAAREDVLRKADLVASVRSLAGQGGQPPAELAQLRSGQAVVGFLDPLGSPAVAQAYASKGLTLFSMELVPRTTRAQSMDALSSMATVVGYKAVLLAASTIPRLMPMLMTAAGTVQPAKGFVIGAGVAGLQAIATARRLGAVLEAYDVRPAVKEQVQSLGAKFVELPLETGEAQDKGGYAKALGEDFYRRQRELMGQVLERSDFVIATAAIPGKKAPVLVTREMVERMKPGSVIVDIAAEQGGNCELTRAGETVVHGGVSVIGPLNLASTAPYHASQLYATNVANLLKILVGKEGALVTTDEIAKECLVAQGGEVVHPRVREALGLPALQPVS